MQRAQSRDGFSSQQQQIVGFWLHTLAQSTRGGDNSGPHTVSCMVSTVETMQETGNASSVREGGLVGASFPPPLDQRRW
ncbi:hypothetical protein PC129_g2185 [Phytophthora cactorum]|uniref:Uncharacterized protein n=1 Tax=Phytophthora cactorum TaxID=29920 RepID=A0A8T1EB64_9STRA|nr:hypothetical protein Pcac1_g12889 [Phytophthora cactorum]KAG2926098.1 hypothetical protein PC114_g3883 [Phytophthora cactorum]KAG2951289.1 hypothetical protein PC117_g3719 [Phytophthora cactorum]KAG3039927.1 hypothetical protein PC119_g1801 [Phytophthora cactorum]KAG3101145.1 hypothetical protein PC122_g2839 [Phytophthora cactorum]